MSEPTADPVPTGPTFSLPFADSPSSACLEWCDLVGKARGEVREAWRPALEAEHLDPPSRADARRKAAAKLLRLAFLLTFDGYRDDLFGPEISEAWRNLKD
jgi:hypothetical protein